jgi:LAS superfamily LD-carboxypeptidase LdcB
LPEITISTARLFGQDDSHLRAYDPDDKALRLDASVWPAWLELKSLAAEQGIVLCAASSYRSFDRQLAIWNAKACGQRPLLDGDGKVLSTGDLSPRELVLAILRWSALPGLSRHHWGTDLDVVDGACIEPGYQVQLTVAETCSGGVFEGLHVWLDSVLAQEGSGFYRPYQNDHGGVAPEPWHLSFQPTAHGYEQIMSAKVARKFIASTAGTLALADTVLQHFDEIYDRFVCVW